MKTKYFELTKKTLIALSYADTKPREWYSINKNSGFREVRYFSIEKHTNQNIVSYGITIGPLHITVGWMEEK